jgi:hypothetical protein
LSDEEQSPARARLRQRVASAYDWNSLVHRIVQEMCDGLGRPYSERLQQVAPLASPSGDDSLCCVEAGASHGTAFGNKAL